MQNLKTQMQLHVIEGNTQKLDGGAMFGNAPKALWSRWAETDELNRIPLACRALLAQSTDGQNYLFETGVGAFFDPKLKDRYGVIEEEHILLKNLEALGLSHKDIHHVILSHLHFDHAGGLLSAFDEGEPDLLFPNAQFYVGKEHWERAKNPVPRDRASFIPFIQEKLESSSRLHLIEGNKEPSLPFLRFRYSHGHTPGLIISEFQFLEQPLFFVSDLIPGINWVNPALSMGYDRFPELLVEEKQNFLDEAYSKNALLFLTHDPTTPCIRIDKNEKGKYQGIATALPKQI